MIKNLLVHIDDDGMMKRTPFLQACGDYKAEEQGVKVLSLQNPQDLHAAVSQEIESDPIDLSVVSDVNMPGGGFAGSKDQLGKLIFRPDRKPFHTMVPEILRQITGAKA